MIIKEEKYCIASKSFPLKFYRCGRETDVFEAEVLRTKESCEYDLEDYDEPDDFQILKVIVSYEI